MTDFSNNWRLRSSQTALPYLLERLDRFGITRVANITGLDFTGIPVFTAFRPRALTLSVSCGKGITTSDSIVSAIMESIETDTAESLSAENYFHTSYTQLPRDESLDVQLLPVLSSSIFRKDIPYSWIKCSSLLSNQHVFLPAATITLDVTSVIDPLMTFVWGSNGLASGFSLKEAIVSALYEYIERDSIICWSNLLIHGLVKDAFIDLSTIPFSSTQSLVTTLQVAGYKLFVYDRSSSLNIPVYRAVLYSPYDQTARIAEGYGCHHLDEIAVNRAITEAVQSRTVMIAGARDDISFANLHDYMQRDLPEKYLSETIIENFSPLKNNFESLDSALEDLTQRLTNIGVPDLYYYSFPVSDPEIFVVRIFIPGLQHYSHRHSVTVTRVTPFIPRLGGLRSALYSLRSQTSLS